MKKPLNLIIFGMAALSFILFNSCEIGLGASVDTDPPSLEIINPPVDSIVRGDFAVSGNWTDDGTIAEVKVKLTRTDGKGTPVTATATVVTSEKGGKGTWSAPLSPSNAGILDGSYEALVEIVDNSGHKTTQSRTFALDNTAPVIVLQRPGTKITETPDAYGQTFSLNGMGADDNSIDHIDINIYSDAECTQLLKTITKSNVPPTIELDVAVFEDGVENDYAAIYGSATKNGAQTRYCTITAYDNAQSYPATGEQTDADKKGNSTSSYYLYDDIYDTVLDHYTITDVYKMLNGTYLLSGTNRSADTVSNVKSLLNQYKIEKSNFSLDPENNPLFFVNGRDPLTGAAADFEGSDYNITTGSSVVVEIATGLDGIPLEASSLRPYLLQCDANGNPQVADTPENRIYLAEAGSGAKSGTSYKFTVNFNHTTTYSNEKFLYLGNTYIVRVEGHDKNGNTIISKGGVYGFKLTSNGAAPGLTITKPASTISYVKANGKQTFEGVVTCQDGYPTITIKNGSTVLWTKSFTRGDETNVNGVLRFDFSHDIDYNGVTENSQIQYTVVANIGDLETTTLKTVIYDKDAPTVSVNEPTPIASKYNRANENSPLIGENYLNGIVKLKVSVNDDYDAVDTETEGKKPYFEIINAQTNAAIPVKFEASSHVLEETVPTEKHYIKRLINGEFSFNTAGVQGISDNTHIKFRFHAWDRAGNEIEYIYPEENYSENNRNSYYIVDQTTDAPVVLPADDEISLLFTSKATRDAVAETWTDQNRVRRAQVASGSQFMLKMLDDDGIKSWAVYRAALSSTNENETVADIDESRFVADSGSGNSTVNSKEIIKSVTVPSSGYYWYKIKLVDLNDNELTPNPVFLVKVTTAAPIITLAAVTTDTDSTVGEYIGAAGAAKDKWKNKIEIESSESPFTLYRATATIENGNFVEPADDDYHPITFTSETNDSKIIYDTIPRGSYTANQRFYYYVRDNNQMASNIKYITCKYDGIAPTLTISNPGTGENAKTGTNAINTSTHQFRGEITENISISSVYYKVVAANTDGTYTAPSAPAENIAAAASWTGNGENGGWTSASPDANWSFYRDIGSASGAIAEGKYKIYMYALDGAGNLSARAEREFHVDLAAPVVTATAPEYVNASTNSGFSRKVTISGSVVETHGLASFTINGQNILSSVQANGSWTYDNTPAADGTYTYTITATDLVGKTNTSLSKTVIIDTVAPTVDVTKITTPDGNQTENTIFKFEGAAACVADTGSGLDKVELAFTSTNSAPSAAQTSTTPASSGTSMGSWSSTVEFANSAFGNVFSTQGTKYLWVRVFDKAGNVSEWTSKEFVYDTGSPVINSLTVKKGTEVLASSYTNAGITFEVEASDSYGIQNVKIARAQSFTSQPDNWSTGGYCTDAACNTAATTFTPSATYYTSLGQATLSSEKYTKAFRVGSETTEGAVHLADRTYNFVVTATDHSGKTASETKTITVDTTNPSGDWQASSPAGTEVQETGERWYNSSSVRFAIAVTEANIDTVEITKDGGATYETMIPSGANYTATLTGFSEGQKTVTVRMKDRAGNSATTSKTIYFDLTAPTLGDITGKRKYMPSNGFTVSGSVSDSGSGIGSLRIKEEKKSSGSFAVTTESGENGLEITVTNGSWSKPLPFGPLSEGEYRYTVTLTDKAGNTTTETFTTTVDTFAPELSITNPADNAKTGINAINTSSYQFSGSVDEANEVSAIYYQIAGMNEDGTYTQPSAASWTGWTSITAEKEWSFYRDIKTGTNPIAEGKYTIYMYAVDGAGNVSTAAASREFHVDMADPVITTWLNNEVLNATTEQKKNAAYSFKFKITESNALAASNPVSITVKKDTTALETSAYSIKQGDTTIALTELTAGTEYTIEIPNAEDALYTYEISATDIVGKSGSATRVIRLDTTAPVISVSTPDLTSWQSANNFNVIGSANDASGTQAVYYVLNPTLPEGTTAPAMPTTANALTQANWESAGWTAANGSDSWNISLASVPNNGTNKLFLAAVDIMGNVTTTAVEKTVKVDATEPELEGLYYVLQGGTSLTPVSGTLYLNREKTLTIYGKYNDNLSQADLTKLKFAVSGTEVTPTSLDFYRDTITGELQTQLAGKTYTAATANELAAATYWKAEFPKTIAAGALSVSGSNGAGGIATSSICTIKEDTGDPEAGNIKISEKKTGESTSSTTYSKTTGTGTSAVTTWYTNNTDKTFTITGVATDLISGVASVTLKVENTATASAYDEKDNDGNVTTPGTKPADITDMPYTGSLSNWEFKDIDIHTWLTGAKATVTVTDNAGNSKDTELNIVFDTTAPVANHELDASTPDPKDLYFRIGAQNRDDGVTKDTNGNVILDSNGDASAVTGAPAWNASKDKDVGAKYANGTYGNDTSIEIRGRFDDSGSGVKEIFYKIFSTDQTDTALDALKTLVLDAPNGSFSLRDESTKRVFYTKSDSMPAGDNNTNKITVDGNDKYYKDITTNYREKLTGFNEGNNYLVLVAVDNVGNSSVDAVTIGEGSTPVTYPNFSLNIDRTAPTLTSNTTETLYTNAASGKTIALSGSVSDDAAGVSKVVILHPTETENGKPKEIKATLNNGTWTYSLDATILASATDTTSIYAKAYDKAGSGNWTKVEVAKVIVDTTDPIISLDAPDDADESNTSARQINGIINLTGTASDKIGTIPNNKFTVTKLQYKMTKNAAGTEVTNNWADVTTSLMPNLSIASSKNYTILNFDTTKLTDKATYQLRAVVEDDAGNVSYSDESYTDDSGNIVEQSPVTVMVDQDSDRPKITLSNLTLQSSGTSYLKSTDTLYLSVTDDDGIAAGGVKYKIDGGEEKTLNGTSIKITGDNIEGEHTITFTITDKAGGVFSSTDSTKPKPKITDGSTNVDTGSLVFTVVKKQPEINNVSYVVKNTKTNATETRTALGTLGGDYTNFKISLAAKATSGISKVTAKFSDTIKYDLHCSESHNDANFHTWETVIQNSQDNTSTPYIDIANLSGITKFDIIVEDGILNDPMKKEMSVEFAYDNTAPEVTITKVSGTAGVKQTMQFYTNESSITYFYVSEDDVTSVDSLNDNVWTAIHNTEAEAEDDYILSESVQFDDTNRTNHTKRYALYLVDLGITTLEALNAATNPFDTLTNVKFWIKAIDRCGNIGYESTVVTVDPQGNRPVVALQSGSGTLKEGSTNEYQDKTTGGSIRFDGTVSDDVEAKYVWMQIDSTGINRDSNPVASDGFKKDDLTKLKDAEYTIGDMRTNEIVSSVDSIAEADVSNYGIRIPVNGNSWNFTINENSEFKLPNGEEGEAILAITIYATDADPVQGSSTPQIHRSRPITQKIFIDSQRPYFKQDSLRLVHYTGNTEDASQSYTEGASVHGIWYLQGKIIDTDNGIKSVSIDGTQRISAAGAEYNHSTDSHYYVRKVERSGKYDYEFSVPIGNDDDGKVGTASVTISAKENTTKELDVDKTFSVTYDNKAPEFITTASDVNVSLSQDVNNTNGFFYFGAKASEANVNGVAQSGVERIAFYFTRDLTYGLQTKDPTTYSSHTNSTTKDLFDVMIYHANTDTADVDSGNMIIDYDSMKYEDGLYWHTISGTVNGPTFTITATDAGTKKKNLHKGGLAKINGVIYLINGVSGNNVTLSSNVTSESTAVTAYFAVCNVIDHSGERTGSTLKSAHEYGYGYYTDGIGDDGDMIMETFTKSSSDWIFDASINSKNLPDGPIKLHMVAFDKAGNYSEEYTMTGTVKNNAPRIAGLKIGTDLNGNGSVDEGEYVETYSGYYELGMNGKNEVFDATFPVKATPEAAQTSLLTIKGHTVVKPEIIGGNGKLTYSYSVKDYDKANNKWGKKTITNPGQETETITWEYETAENENPEITVDGPESGIGIGTTDAVANVSDIILPVSDFIGTTDGTDSQLIKDGKLKKFTFKFKDSTPSTSANDTTSSSTSKLNVILDVALRETKPAKNWILPFYWNSKTDNSLFKQSVDEGHIELAKDWVTTSTYTTNAAKAENEQNAEYDADPKVSGRIKIDGIAQDDTLLSEIKVQFGTSMGGMTTANTTIANYNPTGGNWTVTALENDGSINSTTGWASAVQQATYGELVKVGLLAASKVTDDPAKVGTEVNGVLKEYLSTALVKYNSQEFGHVVHWILYLDTALVDDVAATDVTVTATATDRAKPTWSGTATEGTVAYGSNTVVVTTTENNSGFSGALSKSGETVTIADLTGTYRVDVVPYITKLYTGISDSAGEEFARSATGKYIVRESETVKMYGFNLKAGQNAVRVSYATGNPTSITPTTGGTGYVNLPIGTNANSGAVSITVNSVESLNNKNSNPTFSSTTDDTITAYAYNSQADGVANNRLTDDVELWVWTTSAFDNVMGTKKTNVNSPMMKMDNLGNWYISYGNGSSLFSIDKNGTSTDLEICYNKYHNTNVAFDSSGNFYGVATNTDRVDTGRNDATSFTFFSRALGKYYESTNGNYPKGNDNTYVGSNNTTRANYYNGSNKRRLELSQYGGSNGTYNVNRVQRPKLTVSGDNDSAKVYMAYYDASADNVKFRYGVVSGTEELNNNKNGLKANKMTLGLANNLEGNTATNSSASGYHLIADTDDDTKFKAGAYTAVGYTSDGKAVVAWYDAKARRIVYSYNNNPDTAVSSMTNNAWQTNAVYLDEAYTGWYVDLVVDAGNHVHIAYYNSKSGDLKYVYIPTYNAVTKDANGNLTGGATVVTVDSYLSVGTNITINVRDEGTGTGNNHVAKYVPYIYYYNTSNNQTMNSVKVAWQKDTTLRHGAINDKYTGAWECMTIPTENIPVDATVCGGVPTSNTYQNTVVLGYMTDEYYEKAYIKGNIK